MGSDQRHTSFQGLRFENMDCISNRVIQIEFLQFDLGPLFQQSPQRHYDFSRTLIISADVIENGQCSIEIWWIGLQILLRSVRIVLNGSQWLIELMGDGG